jgi:hypothetical protein
MAAAAAEPYAAVGPVQRDARVVVGQVMEEAGSEDARDPLCVEAEEVDAGDAVAGDVRPHVEFGEPDAERFGNPRRSDGDVGERDDRKPRRAVVHVGLQPVGEVRVHHARVDRPVLEQEMAPPHL